MKLYEIPPEIDEFERILIENGGELTPELEQRWSDFIGASKEKLENAAFVICRMEDDAEACREEEKRLANRRHSFDRNSSRLRDLTLYALKALGGRLKTALVSMHVGRSGEKIRVEAKEGTDLKSLHEQHPELVRVKYELNLDEAKAVVKAGFELPGCLMVTREPAIEHLVIR